MRFLRDLGNLVEPIDNPRPFIMLFLRGKIVQMNAKKAFIWCLRSSKVLIGPWVLYLQTVMSSKNDRDAQFPVALPY